MFHWWSLDGVGGAGRASTICVIIVTGLIDGLQGGNDVICANCDTRNVAAVDFKAVT